MKAGEQAAKLTPVVTFAVAQAFDVAVTVKSGIVAPVRAVQLTSAASAAQFVRV